MAQAQRNFEPKKEFSGGKLKYKLHLTGEITLETGLHIGGSEVDLDIGGLDNEVVKIKTKSGNVPYIPGSSLKGKIRSLIRRMNYNFDQNKGVTDIGIINELFGDANSKTRGRTIFRDCYLKDSSDFNLENKSENVIDSVTGGATPRNMERITKGAVFVADIIVDIYKNDNETSLLNALKTGLNLLSFDYLGGSGSRGYGQISFKNNELSIKKIEFDLNQGKVNISEYEPLKLKG